MRTLRCKCGEAIMWTSDTVHDCQGCSKCNTTFSGRPDGHKPLQLHTWGTMYNQNTGRAFKICSKCGHIDEDSFKESEKIHVTPDIDYMKDNGNNNSSNGPKNLEDAIIILSNQLINETDEISKTDEKVFTATEHHGLGRFLRNEWGLWSGSKLQIWFKERGIHHADDMSGIILTSFHRRLNDKPLDLDDQIKYYRKYWAKVDPNINEGKNNE